MSPPAIRCEDALRLLAEYLDQELADVYHVEVEQHLSTCRSCYSRAEFERRLKKELSRLRDAEVPDGLERRLRTIIVGEPPQPVHVLEK
jgi:anti-sigma factor (TIGR02949 family)